MSRNHDWLGVLFALLNPHNHTKAFMRTTFHCLALLLAFVMSGCSTTQQVTLAKASPTKAIAAVAQTPQEGNSAEMTGHLIAALQAEGVSIKAPLPAGTRTTTDVDAIISYGDSWRWDLVMYLRSLSLQMYDAKTGDLLVAGDWKDSALHGFRDAKTVMQGLVSEMLAKLRSATKAP